MVVAVLLFLALYACIALEAWSLSHPTGPDVGTARGLDRDLADLEVTPVEMLRLPLARALMTGPLTAAGVTAARVPRVRAAGPEVWRRS